MYSMHLELTANNMIKGYSIQDISNDKSHRIEIVYDILFRFDDYLRMKDAISFDKVYQTIVYNWYIFIHESLRLQINILNLRISGCFKTCLYNLQIQAYLQKYQFLKSFLFCGIYSNIHFYPPSNLIGCQISWGPHEIVHMSTIFDLIAPNVIANNKIFTDFTHRAHFRLHHINIHELDETILSLYFTTVRFKTVEIKLLNLSSVSKNRLFDGPGFFSDELLLSSNKTLYKCLSFVCFLQITLNSKIPMNTKVDFHGKINPPIWNNVSLDDKVSYHILNIDPSFETHMQKIFMIEAPENYHVNLSVLQFIYNGSEHSGCHYGGISIFNNIKMSELLTICTSNPTGSHASRNIYSNNDKIMVIIYSHMCYSSVKSTIYVSSTSCELIKPDLCMIPDTSKGYESLTKVQNPFISMVSIDTTSIKCSVIQLFVDVKFYCLKFYFEKYIFLQKFSKKSLWFDFHVSGFLHAKPFPAKDNLSEISFSASGENYYHDRKSRVFF